MYASMARNMNRERRRHGTGGRQAMTVTEIIDKTARAVVMELKQSDMLSKSRLGSFKKTERILYEYPELCRSDDEEVRKFVAEIDRALDKISDDPYFELIEMKYFRGWTHERIAEHFGVDVSVISKRRTKLIDQLRPMIFTRDFVREMLDM
jgi:RNA polymerase sigma factor (sigma-70 family)